MKSNLDRIIKSIETDLQTLIVISDPEWSAFLSERLEKLIIQRNSYSWQVADVLG
jgi:hypothetical protein